MLARRWLLLGLSAPIMVVSIGGGCLDLQTAPPNGTGGQTGMDTSSSSGTGADSGSGASGGSGGSGATGGSGGSGGGVQKLPTVNCDGKPCAAGDVCCFDNDTPPASTCEKPGMCLPDEVEIPCDGPSDCKDDGICCAVVTNLTVFVSVTCKASCDGPNDMVLCTGDESVCPPGKTCQQSAVLGSGYFICKQ